MKLCVARGLARRSPSLEEWKSISASCSVCCVGCLPRESESTEIKREGCLKGHGPSVFAVNMVAPTCTTDGHRDTFGVVRNDVLVFGGVDSEALAPV